MKKDGIVYSYTENDVAIEYPTLCDLLLYRCLQVDHSIKDFSLTGQVDEYGNENLAEWADEVILFVTNQHNCQSIIEIYKDYGSCMHYEKEKELVRILKEEQGIPLFHELYQKSIPLAPPK